MQIGSISSQCDDGPQNPQPIAHAHQWIDVSNAIADPHSNPYNVECAQDVV